LLYAICEYAVYLLLPPLDIAYQYWPLYTHPMTLLDQIQNLDFDKIATPDVKEEFLTRAAVGNLTRDEDLETHFNVYFLPYNPATKEVFIVHHKKANSWISPGGHIDKGEPMEEAVLREIREELGVIATGKDIEGPFVLTTKVLEAGSKCLKHYDSWFLYRTDGSSFKIDPTEFYATEWVSLDKIFERVVNDDNITALKTIKSIVN
jgi:8-oxo-dGTP pyrophosphatase MutT (NUDIX family)